MAGAASITGRRRSPKTLCGFVMETDFAGTDEAVLSGRGSLSTDDKGDLSASAFCVIASTASGFLMAIATEGLESLGAASGTSALFCLAATDDDTWSGCGS